MHFRLQGNSLAFQFVFAFGQVLQASDPQSPELQAPIAGPQLPVAQEAPRIRSCAQPDALSRRMAEQRPSIVSRMGLPRSFPGTAGPASNRPPYLLTSVSHLEESRKSSELALPATSRESKIGGSWWLSRHEAGKLVAWVVSTDRNHGSVIRIH